MDLGDLFDLLMRVTNFVVHGRASDSIANFLEINYNI